jgi:hypothetical protein
MNLYIRIKDGQPFEHPLFEDNVKQVWPDIDLNNLPPELAKFERVQPPVASAYEVLEGFSYQLVDGIYKDVWHLRPMTDSEKQERNAKFMESFNAGKEFLLQKANKSLTSATDAQKPIWQDYITNLTNWVVEDITNVNYPKPPKFDANGNLITINNSGSVPKLIG